MTTTLFCIACLVLYFASILFLLIVFNKTIDNNDKILKSIAFLIFMSIAPIINAKRPIKERKELVTELVTRRYVIIDSLKIWEDSINKVEKLYKEHLEIYKNDRTNDNFDKQDYYYELLYKIRNNPSRLKSEKFKIELDLITMNRKYDGSKNFKFGDAILHPRVPVDRATYQLYLSAKYPRLYLP